MIPAKIGFIGLGHIGGSVAKTIHRIYPGITLIAYDTSKETLELAIEEGVIAQGYDSITEDFAECNYIYLCAPVLYNADYLPAMKQLVEKNPHMLITDVGSVKTGIHEQVIATDLEENFIGGHPMCGTEHTGYPHSSAYMLENAYYIITPSAKVSEQKVAEFVAFTDTLDAITMVLDYEEHDFMVGAISHLPHVISATLVNLVKQEDNEKETLRTIAAGGFKDITRISSSSPLMWENICRANKGQILKLIDTYMASMTKIRATIEAGEGKDIYSFFESAKDYRDTFSNAVPGPLGQTFHMFVDITDEAGGIATVTTILSTNNINIKNIGITHNREFQNGALSLEFYTYAALKQAVELLEKYHYTVYEK
ncbi:MAG: prephenate dehydrogenase/arogenate dehydrogenase family protein [Eubacterium sp.]|nr:prephenate dehydrogenase/arogenate dehydrogenase family protein [Eubacterium sp.]